ncbi:putative quinol monooxygenase [Sphingobacterium rhinopitheci]|uniref:putative quinol monooxygenase n=1 Tax=Sphingobacterium rhinopitheci TaxID=2781960 RepID=UPI001F51DBB0|nr:antibiotic biosynthesis monooxygenase [Sphingobacterium rhinopitheci]MCI0922535.1 antibiotic biosynthesis monooxygenase [Sphingobacterium rhinopitheci]
MITVLTKLKAKNKDSSKKLKQLLEILQIETPDEKGSILYEIYNSDKDVTAFYIFEKWATQFDLDNHIVLTKNKGYDLQAFELLDNDLENIILSRI